MFLSQKVLWWRVESQQSLPPSKTESPLDQRESSLIDEMEGEWGHKPRIASVLTDLNSLALLSQGGAVSGTTLSSSSSGEGSNEESYSN